ncbi:glucan endo-1,3-beta-glucosidase 5-like [Vicia villosa]|uniref:glucan endo-1,3-beta-glucosidase 5-like n=1 Tax=Vicia villosa TaxID=3911 RepID=UPI00273CC48B|nr:glucan endo-1,3-beta-glucosidase 5-like [Vicia villosa]
MFFTEEGRRKREKIVLTMERRYVFVILFYIIMSIFRVGGFGVNWGTQSTHPLPPTTIVKMLKHNGITKVKLFDADPIILDALKKSAIEVMVGIPNSMLKTFATSPEVAEDFVSKNISSQLSAGVDIRYIAVGNQPFLYLYKGAYESTTLPALQNIQMALVKARLEERVRVTVPLNADVFKSSSDNPSDGEFNTKIHELMIDLVQFLYQNNGPFTVNIYPFKSVYRNPTFPMDYAFFDGFNDPSIDNGLIYDNLLDANIDTLVWALSKYGFGNMSIVVGEIGWPTDGDKSATSQLAQRFHQGLMTRLITGKGTPMRPGPMDVYLFSLIDEDNKTIQPTSFEVGNFDRHWGLFRYDGQPKYQLNTGSGANGLVGATEVKYQDKKWCILKPSANPNSDKVARSVSKACQTGDCSSLGYGTSCGGLDVRGNISYAFNSFYQVNDQIFGNCDFSGLSETTDRDPSTENCKFQIMIDSESNGKIRPFRIIMFVLLFFTLV